MLTSDFSEPALERELPVCGLLCGSRCPPVARGLPRECR